MARSTADISAYAIDPPGPFAPAKEWWEFLGRLKTLDQKDPSVQDAKLLATEHLEVIAREAVPHAGRGGARESANRLDDVAIDDNPDYAQCAPRTGRFLFVDRGKMLGDPNTNPAGMLLVELTDGRTWRRATAEDIRYVIDHFPGWFRFLREYGVDDDNAD